MKMLVTGATGFVGRAVVAALAAQGDEVHAAIRTPPDAADNGSGRLAFPQGVTTVRHGDLGAAVDWTGLLSGIDAVVHLAGIAHAGPGIAEERYDRVNHRATAALAAAARDAGVSRLVFVSSIRAQTGPAAEHVVSEQDAPRPTDAYGRSKLAAERAVAASGVPFTILRRLWPRRQRQSARLDAARRAADPATVRRDRGPPLAGEPRQPRIRHRLGAA